RRRRCTGSLRCTRGRKNSRARSTYHGKLMTNLKRWFFVLLAFITGMVLSFQARVNSFVAEDLGDSFAASAFVFISSGIIVVVVLLMIRRTRKTLGLPWIQVREGQIPPYLLLGGIGGVMGIMAQTFAVQIVGVALFSL